VLCSPSLRTRETAELVLAASPSAAIRFEDGLYLAGRVALMRRLSSSTRVSARSW